MAYMAPETDAKWVVLASRADGDIRVTLVWMADSNTVAALLRDANADEDMASLVEPETNPVDVYEHPYAYAAWRGVNYRIVDVRSPAR